MTDRAPIATDPREHVADELTARGWSILDLPPVTFAWIFSWFFSRSRIDEQVADGLSVLFGTSPAFWLNLDASYQRWKETRDGE